MSMKRWRRWLRVRPIWALSLACATFFVSTSLTACSTPLEDAPGAALAAEGEDADTEVTGITESAVYTEDEWSTVEDAALPQSSHPYRNNLSQRFEIAAPGCARAVRLRFSRLELRSGDTLTLYDANGRRVQRFTGSRQNVVSNPVESANVSLILRTNGSGTGYGFAVSAVQIVQGPIPCPRIAWRMCGPGEVTMAADPQPLCSCPRPPRCEPLAEFAASFGAGGGFSGGSNGKELDGEGRIWRVTRLTAGSPEERALVGYASVQRLKALAETAQGQDFFRRDNPAEVANMTAHFTARQGGLQAAASWGVGNAAPESMTDLVTAFGKAVSCGTDADSASCASGFTCQDFECVERASCVCPRFYAPVCSVYNTTYGNTCEAACAGQEIAHEGACGQDGDRCGGTRGDLCLEGHQCNYAAEYDPATLFTEPQYPGQVGVCQGTTACRCAKILAPVCTTDGMTYENECTATACNHKTVAHAGPCGNPGDDCGLTGWNCLPGLECRSNGQPTAPGEQGVCEEPPSCVCPAVYMPVCGVNDVTYSNGCAAACAQVAVRHDGECGVTGDTCGTIRGLACAEGFKCRYAESTYAPPFPDAGGTCVPYLSCDAPSECGWNVRLSCPATWFCENHACRFECNAPVETWEPEASRFESRHPYANNARQGWTATGPTGTTAVRFVFDAFDTERGYDFVTLYDEGWNEVARYSGALGAFTTGEVAGRVAHLVFTSDASVTAYGFVGVRVEYRRPQ
jgi:hypothetical protein